MARRTKQEAQETRTLILDTAEMEFRDRGVGHTTLTDIAARAGVTRGAIYWHFDNKAALVQAVNDRVHLPLEALNQMMADAGLEDPLAKLRESALLVLCQAARDERTHRVFEIFAYKCEYVDEMAAMLERQRESRRHCVRAIAENLRHAVDKGQLPRGLDAEGAAVHLYAAVGGLIDNWLLDPDSFDLPATGAALVDRLVAGLRAART